MYEPVGEPRPCGYQGQTLPGLGSDNAPTHEGEETTAGGSEEIESDGSNEGQPDVSSEYDEIEVEHNTSDDMVAAESLEDEAAVDKDLDSAITINSASAAAANNTIERLIEELEKVKKQKKGSTKQYKKNGGYPEAVQDFESLNPQNVRDLPGGKIGKHGVLADGRDVIVRLESSADCYPTLEVQTKNSNKRIKIRYVGNE